MKKRIFAFLIAISSLVAFSGCSTSSSTTATPGTTTVSGTEVGSAVHTLYSSFKETGSISPSNLTNLAALTTVITGAKSYKANLADKSFYQSFATGLISGSSGTVTKNNVSSVLSSLTSIADATAGTAASAADSATSTASATSESVLSTVSSLSSLFSGL